MENKNTDRSKTIKTTIKESLFTYKKVTYSYIKNINVLVC